MIKFREKKKSVYIEPYNFVLHLIVSNDIFKSFDKTKLKFKHEPMGLTHAFVWRLSESNDIYAFLPENASAATIVHEMFHVIAFIHREVGVLMDISSEEAWAYHLDSLTSLAFDFIHAPKKKQKGN
jgi:hypothetical protein